MSASIGIFYGSTTGNTERIAQDIAAAIGPERVAGIHDVAKTAAGDLARYDVLILGVPTWNIGDVQDDWAALLPELTGLNLAGKKVALFGLGDQRGYPDSFVDALGEVWAALKPSGAELIGLWPTSGYDFVVSRGLYDDAHFLGLALDEDRESFLTEERIAAWVAQLNGEIAGELVPA
jgi:flavodoxin I